MWAQIKSEWNANDLVKNNSKHRMSSKRTKHILKSVYNNWFDIKSNNFVNN